MLSGDRAAVRLRAAAAVQKWLAGDLAMAAYGGPADLSMSLDSLGDNGAPAIHAPRALHDETDGDDDAATAATAVTVTAGRPGSGGGLGGSLAQTLEDSDEEE